MPDKRVAKPKTAFKQVSEDADWGPDIIVRKSPFDGIEARLVIPYSKGRQQCLDDVWGQIAAALEANGTGLDPLLVIDSQLSERAYLEGIRDGVKLSEGKRPMDSANPPLRYFLDKPDLKTKEFVAACESGPKPLPIPAALRAHLPTPGRPGAGPWQSLYSSAKSRQLLEKYIARLRKQAIEVREADVLYKRVLRMPQIENLKGARRARHPKSTSAT